MTNPRRSFAGWGAFVVLVACSTESVAPTPPESHALSYLCGPDPREARRCERDCNCLLDEDRDGHPAYGSRRFRAGETIPPDFMCISEDDAGFFEHDCNDHDCTAYPGSTRGCDCRVGGPHDSDYDGYPAACGSFPDCDDAKRSIHPGAIEICDDGIDSDCNPAFDGCHVVTTDLDGDGYSAPADCNDFNVRIHPGAPESVPCDFINSNCDGNPC
jgi:hypothetical protein